MKRNHFYNIYRNLRPYYLSNLENMAKQPYLILNIQAIVRGFQFEELYQIR
jgi:hypothetical protein